MTAFVNGCGQRRSIAVQSLEVVNRVVGMEVSISLTLIGEAKESQHGLEMRPVFEESSALCFPRTRTERSDRAPHRAHGLNICSFFFALSLPFRKGSTNVRRYHGKVDRAAGQSATDKSRMDKVEGSLIRSHHVGEQALGSLPNVQVVDLTTQKTEVLRR